MLDSNQRFFLPKMYQPIFENVALEGYHFGMLVQVMVAADSKPTPVCFDMVENAGYADSEPSK